MMMLVGAQLMAMQVCSSTISRRFGGRANSDDRAQCDRNGKAKATAIIIRCNYRRLIEQINRYRTFEKRARAINENLYRNAFTDSSSDSI